MFSKCHWMHHDLMMLFGQFALWHQNCYDPFPPGLTGYWLLCDPVTLIYGRPVDLPVFLVGNKQDLCNARQVHEEEGQLLAQEDHFPFQEVSAAEGYLEISNLFTKLIRHVMENLKYRTDRRRYSGSKSMAKLINNVFGKRRKSVWWRKSVVTNYNVCN